MKTLLFLLIVAIDVWADEPKPDPAKALEESVRGLDNELKAADAVTLAAVRAKADAYIDSRKLAPDDKARFRKLINEAFDRRLKAISLENTPTAAENKIGVDDVLTVGAWR